MTQTTIVLNPKRTEYGAEAVPCGRPHRGVGLRRIHVRAGDGLRSA